MPSIILSLQAAQLARSIDTCWAIDAASGVAFVEALTLQAFDDAGATSGRGDEPGYSVRDGVATLRIKGVMTKDPQPCASLFGTTSTTLARRALRNAVADASVRSVLLDIDSPGGQVAGTSDLADEVFRLREQKPIVAYMRQGCSAAYWVGANASRVICGESSIVGSIGILAPMEDTSEAAKAAGVRVHVVKSAEFKGDGVAGTPITDAQIAEAQRLVDGLHAQFVASVARGRGIGAEAAAKLADGRVHLGAEAKALGLVDSVASDDVALQVAANMARPAFSPSASGSSVGAATRKEPSMPNIKEILAKLRKNPEALAQAGVTEDELTALDNDDPTEATSTQTGTQAAQNGGVSPEIQRQLEELRAASAQSAATAKALTDATLNAAATAFANDLVLAGKANASQRDALATLFRNAALADGGGMAKLTADGRIEEGDNVKAVRATFANASAHRRFGDEIPGVDPTHAEATVLSAEDRKRLLGMTDVGRRALKEIA